MKKSHKLDRASKHIDFKNSGYEIVVKHDDFQRVLNLFKQQCVKFAKKNTTFMFKYKQSYERALFLLNS